MIKNERQYRITKAYAEKCAKTIQELTKSPQQREHPVLRKAQVDAMKSQLEDLQREIKEYSVLRSGKRKIVSLGSLEELPKALIQARIAAGLSQEELAVKLGVKPQQIQRYEATEYQAASFERVQKIMQMLGVKLQRPAALRLAS